MKSFVYTSTVRQTSRVLNGSFIIAAAFQIIGRLLLQLPARMVKKSFMEAIGNGPVQLMHMSSVIQVPLT
jgi:hypothetical protein